MQRRSVGDVYFNKAIFLKFKSGRVKLFDDFEVTSNGGTVEQENKERCCLQNLSPPMSFEVDPGSYDRDVRLNTALWPIGHYGCCGLTASDASRKPFKPRLFFGARPYRLALIIREPRAYKFTS